MTELYDTVQEIVNTDNKALILEKIKTLLDAVKIPESIKDIQNLPIHDFRDLNVQESRLITELLKVKTIKELAKVTYHQLVDRVNLLSDVIPKEKLELLITAAKYIVKATDYKPLEGKKVVIAGLDNAGKTALLKSIKKEVGFADLSGLKPTKGANRGEIFLQDQQLFILELGGQEEFRKFYIDQPDRFFLETDIIVYLIDVQDDARYLESIEYLAQILRTLEYLQETPDFIILFHKFDPDVAKNPILQEKMEYLEKKVQEVFSAYNFTYEIQISSIYNIISMTPSFSRMLKVLFSGSLLEEERKIQSIGILLMKVVDSFLATETQLTREITYLKKRIDELDEKISSGVVSTSPQISEGKKVPQKPKTPLSPPKPKPSGARGGLSTRAALLAELKEVFGLRGKVM
ncbi:MAG: ADP-ribosylation factor-like protein [Candidatus Helarchaeota archaeon]